MGKISRFAGTRLAKGFETSEDAEKNGVWRVHPDFGIHVRVRRATLIDHRRALRRHYKPFQHLTVVDPAQELLVKQKAAAEVLVADWGQTKLDDDDNAILDGADQPIREPLVDAQGVVLNATMENVLDAFTSMPDFFRWVVEEAETFENYRVAVVEQSGGNSKPSSDGVGSGERPLPPTSLPDAQPAVTPSPSEAVVQS